AQRLVFVGIRAQPRHPRQGRPAGRQGTEDRGDGQHRYRSGQAALRDSPAGQAGRPVAVPAARMTSRSPRIRDDVDPELPGIAQPDEAAAVAPSDTDDELTPARPEPDQYTQELPLPEPAPGLGADIVNDVTQMYLNEIGQHVLLTAEEEIALARA